MGSSQTTEVLRTNRIHVIHEELRGVPSGEYLRHRQRSRGNTMILAGQRRQQCVVANLALYVIGEKVNSEVIKIFLNNLVWSLTLLHVNIMAIHRGPLALISWHIWLQLDTCYYRQHLYGQTCKNNIISYQWLNVEQKNVCPGQFPSFFQNQFHVLHIIFASFVRKRIIIFFDFALIQVLIVLSYF